MLLSRKAEFFIQLMVLAMESSYWGHWYLGWGWFLWVGIWFLLFSSLGNWGYSYRVHRRIRQQPLSAALNLLNERYARGELLRADYEQIKADLAK